MRRSREPVGGCMLTTDAGKVLLSQYRFRASMNGFAQRDQGATCRVALKSCRDSPLDAGLPSLLVLPSKNKNCALVTVYSPAFGRSVRFNVKAIRKLETFDKNFGPFGHIWV